MLTQGVEWTHAVAVFGFDDARPWHSLRVVALESRWGQNWKFQAIAATIYVLACGATVWRRAFWPVTTFAAAGFAAMMPLLGHPSGDAVRMALHAVHILAADVWLATLAVVLMAGGRMRLVILRGFAPIACQRPRPWSPRAFSQHGSMSARCPTFGSPPTEDFWS